MEFTPDTTEKPIFLTCRYQVLLICCVILYLFYPSLTAEISLLDDREMINSLSTIKHFDLIGTFFPHSHGGFYYRPMIAVSFLIDRFLWNLDPTIMHFENILLHLLSTTLVFLIGRLIISKTSNLPLLAALVFGVHPISTESVNWISGRTDLLAVMFLLVSLYSILYFRSSKRLWCLAASIVSLLMGIFAKETAVGFVPALFFIMTSKIDTVLIMPNVQRNHRQSFIVFFVACILSLAAALFLFNYYFSTLIVFLYFIYLLWIRREHLHKTSLTNAFQLFCSSIIIIWTLVWGIRKLAFSSQSPHIQRTFGLLFADINHTLALFFRAVGFYTKKFIYPFPLNFVIRDVSPFYSLFGIFLLCLVIVLIVRRKLFDSLVVAGFWMLTPVLPLTFESIAWTSYAERYVYPAVPFWILSLAGFAASAGFDQISPKLRTRFQLGLSMMIVVVSVSTFQRNLVWQTNLDLFKDSVEKTPTYKPIRGLYMTALFEKGLYDLALQQYRVAQSLRTIEFKYNPNYDLFHVQILIAKKQYAEAERELELIDRKTMGKEPMVYETYLELAPQLFLKAVDASEIKRISDKVTVSYRRWYRLTTDPMILYRNGQYLLSANRSSEAAELFAMAVKTFPEKHPFRSYSEKLAEKLSD